MILYKFDRCDLYKIRYNNEYLILEVMILCINKSYVPMQFFAKSIPKLMIKTYAGH